MFNRWIMRKVILGVLLSITGFQLHAETINTVALNIEWFPGQRPRPTPEEVVRHMDDTRNVLTALNPDILIATEICDEAAFRELLQSVPGLELHVISSFSDVDETVKDARRNQQIAIASKFPAFAGWAEPWDSTMEGLRRGFSFVALENPKTGRLIMVYGLHLKSNRSGTPEEEQINYDIRDASAAQLLAHMMKMEQQFTEKGIDGWIIGGDFNTNHDGRFGDKVIAMLENAGFWNSWKNTPAENRHTWKTRPDSTFLPTTFDYILTKNLGQADATLHLIPAEISDHNAVILILDLPDNETSPTPVDESAEPND